MITDALKYPITGDDSLKTLIIGSFLIVGSVLVLPLFVLLGFFIRTVGNAIDGDAPPQFEQYGSLFVEGVKLTAILLTYLSVFLALVVGLVSLTGPTSNAVVLFVLFLFFGFIYVVISVVFQFCRRRQMRDAFAVPAILRTAFSLRYLFLVLLWMFAILILLTIGQELLTVTTVGILAIPAPLMYAFVVYAKLISSLSGPIETGSDDNLDNLSNTTESRSDDNLDNLSNTTESRSDDNQITAEKIKNYRQETLPAVGSYREEVTGAWELVTNVYQGTSNQLIQKHSVELSETQQTPVEIPPSEAGYDQYPATAKPIDHYDSLEAYIDDADEAISLENDALNLIDWLLSNPVDEFLYEEEKQRLLKAQELFTHSVEQGEEQIENIRNHRRDSLQTLSGRAEACKRELEQLETRAEPYLSLNKYLRDDDLLDDAELLDAKISNISTNLPAAEMVSHPVLDRPEKLGERTAQLIEKLKQSRGKYRERQSKNLTKRVKVCKRELEQLEARATPYRDLNEPLSDNDLLDAAESLDAKLSDITELLLSAEITSHPEADQLQELTDRTAQLTESLKQSQVKYAERQLKSLSGRLWAYEIEIGQLEARAKPYLNLSKYPYDDDLLATAEILNVELSNISMTISSAEVTSYPEADRLQDLKQRVCQLIESVKRSRVEYAERQLNFLQSSTQNAINEIQRQLQPAKKRGDPIKSPDALINNIEEIRNDLSEFHDESFFIYLSSEQLDELSTHKKELDESEEFIKEKTRFDKQFRQCWQVFNKLRSDAQPYLDYDKYLTQPTHDDLVNRIRSIKTKLKFLSKKIQFRILAHSDSERFRQLLDDLNSLRSHLQDYNTDFVRRQRQECRSFFTDIGPSNIDLTAEQEQAVIRNGIYNQVIAAAGTGKTLALTTRVAYLINKQDIKPERILVVTYLNEATDEMETRLEDHFDITDVKIKTIHAFGREIIQETRDGYVESIESHQTLNLIDREIREARIHQDKEFLDHYYEFLVHFDDVYYEEEDFDTKREYVKTRAEQDYTTLRGEEVRSRAEKLIADFLFTHQVDYRYEEMATWAETAPDKGEYDPDFYLPEYDIYIEHWGIDESGLVAPWFSWSSSEYHDKMDWARGEFEESDHTLIETYEFEHEAGRLKQSLRHRLSINDVEMTRMDFNELTEAVFEYERQDKKIREEFREFITNAKRFNVTPNEIKANLSPKNPRQYHFGHCGIHMLRQYRRFLAQNGLIDFIDMVQDAVKIIQDHPEEYKDRYDHVLVDEFQDIGKGTLELIQELTGPDTAKLFAVGDDWQSIFSFRGAVIKYFTEFEEYFGTPVRTDLTANFRSPSRIVTAGNQLIQNNDGQLKKQVRSTVNRQTTPRVHRLQGYTNYKYLRSVRDYTLDLVQQYLAQGASPSEIMILCRYDDAAQYLYEIRQGLESEDIPYVGRSGQYRGPTGQADHGAAVYSLYKAKGREAKHVILVHAAEGRYGFPRMNGESELIDPVQPIDIGGLEEERRAFYVAITRSKQTLDILTRNNQESRFIDEIADYTKTVDAEKI